MLKSMNISLTSLPEMNFLYVVILSEINVIVVLFPC